MVAAPGDVLEPSRGPHVRPESPAGRVPARDLQIPRRVFVSGALEITELFHPARPMVGGRRSGSGAAHGSPRPTRAVMRRARCLAGGTAHATPTPRQAGLASASDPLSSTSSSLVWASASCRVVSPLSHLNAITPNHVSAPMIANPIPARARPVS